VRFGTGLFPLGCSPIQKTVVTILFFQGYRRADPEGSDSFRAVSPIEVTWSEPCSGAFTLRGLLFLLPSLRASIWAAKVGSDAMKSAQEKRRSGQRFFITFRIAYD
jgi:hypothetical protein